jgi:hypothetical protein
MKISRIILVASTAMLALNAFAADVTGKYTGRISLDLSDVKKMIQGMAAKAPADKKGQMTSQLAMLDSAKKATEAMTLKLELKKGGVATIEQSQGKQTKKETGKWAVNGTKIRMFGFTGTSGGPKEFSGVVKDGGKTLFFDLSAEMQKQAAAGGAPKGTGGKLTLTFKR